MKKIILAVVLVSVLITGFSACSKVREALFPGIDVNIPAFQFTIPEIPFVLNNEVSLGSFTMAFNLDSIIRANTSGAFGAGVVASVKVKQMDISITNSDEENNLANFETARFTFSSNTNPTPVEIVTINFPDSTASSAVITPTNSPELKSYLTGTQLTYTLYGKARRTTSKPLNFNVAVTLTAK